MRLSHTLFNCLFFFSCSCFSSEHISVYGGNVNFTGQIINSACSVRSDSIDQIVELGQARTNQFKNVGEWGNKIPFKIVLENCDISVSSSVGAMFTGSADSNDPLVFQTSSGPGSVSGIGIGIVDAGGNVVVPNAQPLVYQPLIDGDNTLYFSARYRSTRKDVSGGFANSHVWFSLKYP